jgi:hypothetical protein
MAISENKVLYDVDYLGIINVDGTIKELWGEEALNASIKLWIASNVGEIVRDPNRGGYISRHLARPMREADIDNIKMAIRDGIHQDFAPHLQIEDLRVEADYENRRWKMYLEVYSPDLNISATIDESIKAVT